jgi:UDP-N-acetylmuramyl pentapeptide phosphotransferase/UDP-N-acetylglucosamine-1-phosphate transferase
MVPQVAGVSPYWFGLAALTFAFSCFVTQRLSAVRSCLYWVDVPKERSLHRRPTPRTGGIAILGGIVIGQLLPVIFGWLDGRAANRTNLL